MDFELSTIRSPCVDGMRSLCTVGSPIEPCRTLIDDGGVDAARWRELADTGVFSLVLPEAAGGVGLGYADAVLVFEELGRALVPGPLVGTFLAAGVVDGAATGDAVVGLVERPRAGDGSAMVGCSRRTSSTSACSMRCSCSTTTACGRSTPSSVAALGGSRSRSIRSRRYGASTTLPAGTRIADAADAAQWRRSARC